VTINTGLSAANPVTTSIGFNNIYRSVTVGEGNALATLSSVVRSPENHYVNLHSAVNPGGVVRAQLAPALTEAPVVTAVFAANSDKSATTIAPGGLVSIWGRNLAKVTGDLGGWQGGRVPDSLNAVAVTIGGVRARPLYVSPDNVTVQAAFETPTGAQAVSVHNGNAPSAGVNVTVAATAPALFFGPDGAVALNDADLSGVSAANPARGGDVVLVYATGLGQSTPASESGALGPDTPVPAAVNLSATIGGQNAPVVRAVTVPGYLGLWEVALRVPSGLRAGPSPVVLNAGPGSSSAPQTIAVAP
jgi:uncharacterized protein (TIGR03437 family)